MAIDSKTTITKTPQGTRLDIEFQGKQKSSDNLGRAVKWQDSDKGWHTGRLVTGVKPYRLQVCNNVYDPMTNTHTQYRLVRESRDGRLSWVKLDLLQDWQPRSEWEDKQLPIAGIGYLETQVLK